MLVESVEFWIPVADTFGGSGRSTATWLSSTPPSAGTNLAGGGGHDGDPGHHTAEAPDLEAAGTGLGTHGGQSYRGERSGGASLGQEQARAEDDICPATPPDGLQGGALGLRVHRRRDHFRGVVPKTNSARDGSGSKDIRHCKGARGTVSLKVSEMHHLRLPRRATRPQRPGNKNIVF